MAIWNPDNVILTNKGQEVLSKVQAGVGKLTVTRIVTGSVAIPYSQLYLAEAIPGEKQECEILSTVTDRKGSEISISVNNKHLTEEYPIYTIGVYVTHPDFEGEILYLVAECDTVSPDIMPTPSVTVATLYYSVYMEHTDTDQVEISVTIGANLTNDMLNKPNGVAGLDENGKLLLSVIPDEVAFKEDLKKFPSYRYVLDGTYLNTLIQETGVTPFWSLFTSPQGPVADQKCMYFVYPILGTDEKATGNVYIEATDVSTYNRYVYYGAYSSVATDKWVPVGGSSGGSAGSLAFATCSTAAATGTKTATIDGFELVAGSTMLISFTNPNTAGVVTLDISGTGAKSIVDSANNALSATSAALLRGTCFFVYNGSSYVLLNCVANGTVFGGVRLSDAPDAAKDVNYGYAATPAAVAKAITGLKAPKWGTCTTPASTVAKVATVDNFALEVGSAVMLYVSNANTAPAPTLNVNSSGAKPIVDKNGTALNATTASLLSGLCLLAYDGSNFILLDNMANSSLFGAVKLSDSTGSTSGTTGGAAATPSAVKSAYDLANGKATKVLYSGTLTTTWNAITDGYSQTININGILATDTPVISLVQGSTIDTNLTLLKNWSLVSRIVTAANSITAYVYGTVAPNVALPIQLLCVR